MSRDAVNSDLSDNTTRKRYMIVANALIRDITEGEYVVGSLLPTEIELSEQYGVSRHTVRAALAVLQEKGYISRRKSIGTRVESATPSASFVHAVDSIEGLVRTASAEVRSIENVRVVKLDRAMARDLMAPFESHWVHLSGPRVDPKRNTPLSWANIYIDVAFKDVIDKIRENPKTLISSILEKECGQSIAEIRQVVFGLTIEGELAERLGVKSGSAGLRVLRHYKDDSNRIYEITETINPAERASVSFQFRRASQA